VSPHYSAIQLPPDEKIQNTENYLLTPSPQGDLCVAKLFPPRRNAVSSKASVSDPGHSSSNVVRCEASRNLKWSINNTGVLSPIYKLSLPSPDSADLPLFQISKPNPNAAFWSMFYFAYAGHNIPPKRIEFGKIQKNPPGPNGGGTRISITGKTPEEKAVWQTLGEGNEDCVEWVVLCAALNLLEYALHLSISGDRELTSYSLLVMRSSKQQKRTHLPQGLLVLKCLPMLHRLCLYVIQAQVQPKVRLSRCAQVRCLRPVLRVVVVPSRHKACLWPRQADAADLLPLMDTPMADPVPLLDMVLRLKDTLRLPVPVKAIQPLVVLTSEDLLRQVHTPDQAVGLHHLRKLLDGFNLDDASSLTSAFGQSLGRMVTL
jgi:hypothetical protein